MDTLTIEDVLALPVYPTADIFPMLVDAAEPPAGYDGITIHQFADQILLEGVKEPLVVWNGQLIDGRNRREAARLVNKTIEGFLTELPVRYATFASDEEADDYILSAGLDRRSMNKDQLACAAVHYWPIYEGRQGGDRSEQGVKSDTLEGKTRDLLARRFHVSNSYIQKARSLFINDRPKFELAASGKQRVLAGLKSPGQVITPETDPVEAAERKLNNAVNAVVSSAKGVLELGEGLELEHVVSKLTELLDTLDSVTSASQPDKYFKPDVAPSDASLRWAAEVRVRIVGIDRIANEHGVPASDIALETDPLFRESVNRLSDMLAEIQQQFDVDHG